MSKDTKCTFDSIIFIFQGAILCFLAGWDEIMAVNDALTERTRNVSMNPIWSSVT